jgi:5-methyltetrahydropteroyltriglutamate--homocysteine methyltransferase
MVFIKTTVIGSFPKPKYLNIPDWFKCVSDRITIGYDINDYTKYISNKPKEHDKKLIDAIEEVIDLQDNIGIDILTDGEIGRENYINYHLRHINGIDFNILSQISSRNDAYVHNAPTIIGLIEPKEHFLSNDLIIAQKFTHKPIKITIPGPLTIIDTVYNIYYDNDDELLEDISNALNYEILDLVKNGCKYIQIDEPLLARTPKHKLDISIKYIERCFRDVPPHVCKIVHICCGYPNKLDETDYPKANPNSYYYIAELVDNSSYIDVVSLEDAHFNNDLKLFEKFKKISIILGVINISSSRVEEVDEIKNRINMVLKYIEPQRLIVGPDCGLGMLPLNICIRKLNNMVSAIKSINYELNYLI